MQPASRAARAVRIGAILAVTLTGSACLGNATPAPIASPATSPTASAASALPSTTGSGSPSLPAPPAASPGSATVDLRKVAGGFDQPVFVTGAGDGSGRLFVVEQAGTIRVVRDGTVMPTPFLDISDSVRCCGEQGLLGLALQPGYGSTGHAFVVDYTDVNGDTEIATGTTSSSNPDAADPGSVHTILKVDQPFANHNGGMVAFGPDGYLYVGMGDGGSGGDPQGNGQRLETLLGKILRIDPLHAISTAGYSVPDTNPFIGSSAGARPEIWAFGLRNPWRFSFDRADGDLWIGDVGQASWEEVDVARAADGGGRGLDYGWNRMEGSHCFHAILGCDQAGLAPPLTEYGHGSGDCAVIGGYVYRGPAIPALVGTYLFADECTGTIRAIPAAGPPGQPPVVVLESHRTISSFGEDEVGELYLTDLASGDLLQVVATSP
jgi:glucose/arabinose dehydrogenase